MRTVTALYDTRTAAESALSDLRSSGFSQDDISILAQDADGSHAGKIDETQYVEEAAGAGAVGGTVAGGTIGLLVGLGALFVPGIGPVIAVGALASALGSTALGAGIGAAAGAATGGLTAALSSAGLDDTDANLYAEGVRRGGTLLMLSADDAAADRAAEIMDRHSPVDMKDRGNHWRSEGWSRYDDSTPDTVVAPAPGVNVYPPISPEGRPVVVDTRPPTER